jgi:dTMP kinase
MDGKNSRLSSIVHRLPLMTPGFFITFEGPDGSGKSTQIQALAEYLQGLGQTVLLTREPGGTEISEQIRDLLHDLRNQAMQPRAEILLYSAARAQLVGQVIRPWLAAGGTVLCDRYADSTLAYQGYGHGLDLDTLRLITTFATDGLRPDLTLLFDLDPAVGLLRRKNDGVEWNRLDAYDLAFHQRVRAGYQALAQADPGRWVSLDATLERGALQEQVRQVVREKLEVGSKKLEARS